MPSKATGAARTRRHVQRLQQRGLARVLVVVPETRRAELHALAAAWRDREPLPGERDHPTLDLPGFGDD